MKQQILALLWVGITSTSLATEQISNVLPHMRFASTVKAELIFDKIKAMPAFVNVSKDNHGASLTLRVSHGYRTSAGGAAAGATTGLLAATTLGIIPIVKSHDLVVTYEILANDTVIDTIEFRKGFTDAVNLFSEAAQAGKMSKDEEAWLIGTLPEFELAMSKSEKVKTLVDEYSYYFST